jgi:hypothetical protein
MARARRYQRLWLLCAILAAAAAPSTSRAAYAEVTQSVAAGDGRAKPAARDRSDSPPRARDLNTRANERSFTEIAHRSDALPPGPLYVLYCSLLR